MHRDDDIDKELQFHVDQRAADYMASGLTPAEARRRAALEFGGVTQTKEAIRDQDSWRVLDSILRDVRFAVRSLRSAAPVFALTAVVVFRLGSHPGLHDRNSCRFGPCCSSGADDIVQVRRRTPSGSGGKAMISRRNQRGTRRWRFDVSRYRWHS